jgi:hypothetical protein
MKTTIRTVQSFSEKSVDNPKVWIWRDVELDVVLEIDLEALARDLGRKTFKNKSRRAVEPVRAHSRAKTDRGFDAHGAWECRYAREDNYEPGRACHVHHLVDHQGQPETEVSCWRGWYAGLAGDWSGPTLPPCRGRARPSRARRYPEVPRSPPGVGWDLTSVSRPSSLHRPHQLRVQTISKSNGAGAEAVAAAGSASETSRPIPAPGWIKTSTTPLPRDRSSSATWTSITSAGPCHRARRWTSRRWAAANQRATSAAVPGAAIDSR